MSTTSTLPTCGDSGGRTKSGAPCKWTNDLSPTGLCSAHDPERREEAKAIRAAGGRAGGSRSRAAKHKAESTSPAVPPRMRTLDDAVAVAAWIVDSVLRGDIDARTAESATKAVRQFQLGEEKATLLRRITELEARLRDARADGAGGTTPRTRRGPLEVA